MRILNVIQCTNFGGMEQSNLLRLKGLIARGHDVEVVSLTPLGPLAPMLAKEGIPATGLEYRGLFGWRSLGAMRRAFRARKPDAILMTGHNFAASLSLIGIPAKRKVQAIHHHHFEGARDLTKWRLIYGVANAVFDRFTFCSRYILDEAVAAFPSVAGKASVVPNPFELPSESGEIERGVARRMLGLPEDAAVIGNAGWLIPRKRFDVFLQTAALIAKWIPDAIFLIAGDGPEHEALADLARELGIAKNLRFLGWQSDLAPFYAALDLVLFNSDFDALGRVPIEASAAGVPVVASVLRGGLAEFLRPPDEIILFDRHDPQQLADAAVGILADDGQRTDLSSRAKRRVADIGSPDAHAAEMERLLFALDS
jgi:glycosyltransferase involved in cell wall biosynthesis